ncbi:MAG TPA: hypothetical protein VII67_01375 [Acidimicrobiales bacterium]
MGTTGDKPRKRRRRMAKVPRGAEANNIQLAGLTTSSDGVHSTRLDHDAAHGRSENVGKFGRAFLWLLGRRRKDPPTP